LGFHYCLVVYAVTILFEHIAYTIMLPVFGGMVAALVRTAEVRVLGRYGTKGGGGWPRRVGPRSLVLAAAVSV
jgi:hypothetical protein